MQSDVVSRGTGDLAQIEKRGIGCYVAASAAARSGGRMTRRYDVICCAIAMTWGNGCAWAHAESAAGRPSQVIEGGVGLRGAPPSVSLGGGHGAKQHIGPTGKPCLSVSGDAHAQTINPHIFEHAITANNSCGQVIKLSVCYHGSDRCVPMTVPSYSRQTAILGIEPAMAMFRFEYWERFP